MEVSGVENGLPKRLDLSDSSYVRSEVTDSVFGRIVQIFVIPYSACSKCPRVGALENWRVVLSE